jgi:divalent metal cation (Fe/Co/Zn/Cd) transporter
MSTERKPDAKRGDMAFILAIILGLAVGLLIKRVRLGILLGLIIGGSIVALGWLRSNRK